MDKPRFDGPVSYWKAIKESVPCPEGYHVIWPREDKRILPYYHSIGARFVRGTPPDKGKNRATRESEFGALECDPDGKLRVGDQVAMIISDETAQQLIKRGAQLGNDRVAARGNTSAVRQNMNAPGIEVEQAVLKISKSGGLPQDNMPASFRRAKE